MKCNSAMRGAVAVVLSGLLLSARVSQAKGQPFIGTSLQTLAGYYVATNGIAALMGQSVGIAPDGKVTMKAPGASMGEQRFLNGKITYFSQAGFLVMFTGMKGPIEMRFLFLRKYPTTFFRDDGKTVSVFTRQ